MSEETPKKRRERERSPDTCSVDTILVEFIATLVPHDSPEFQERQRLALQRPIPEYLKPQPKPDQNPPAAT